MLALPKVKEAVIHDDSTPDFRSEYTRAASLRQDWTSADHRSKGEQVLLITLLEIVELVSFSEVVW